MPRPPATQTSPGYCGLSVSMFFLSGSADAPLSQQLARVLHLLYVTAAVLALILLVVLSAAIWVYRRNKAREPHQ